MFDRPLSDPSKRGEVEEAPLKRPFQKGSGLVVDSVVELLGKGASTLVEPGSVFSSALAWLGGVTGSVLASEFFDSESLELAVSLLDLLFFCCFWVCFDAFVFLGFALFCSASAALLSLPNTLSHIVGEVSAACSGPEIMPKRTIPAKKSTIRGLIRGESALLIMLKTIS